MLDKFMETYRAELIKARAEHPAEYSWPDSKFETVLARMRAAFERGSFLNSGRAIKATCKALGIKNTYKAIGAYLKGA